MGTLCCPVNHFSLTLVPLMPDGRVLGLDGSVAEKCFGDVGIES